MRKLKSKKGFTLMEMLIVVAIIVILVVIAVPMMSSKIEDARKAADNANIRAAKGIAVAKALEPDFTVATYYFDAEAGELKTGTPTSLDYGQFGDRKYITVTYDETTKVPTCKWDNE